MEDQNVNNTLTTGAKRVTTMYAGIYLDDNSSIADTSSRNSLINKKLSEHAQKQEDWISPSDLLIGIIKLIPPFTSRITRGKTHEGILNIGNLVLENERDQFKKLLTDLVHDNDDSWNYILSHEKQQIIKKVKIIFENIFKHKSEIMKQELSNFYEQSLCDLEQYLKTEKHALLEEAYGHIISDLNNQIYIKMQRERKKLEKRLQNKYITELSKIKKYYKLLFNNEIYRNNKLINKALQERNEALKIFYKQIEARRITTTMYIMSLERKKCKVRKMLLENLQAVEITEKLHKIKEYNDEIQKLKRRYIGIPKINKHWDKNIKNILELFLKFISFSMKLLPEQTSFLLDLQEMVVLQFQEMKQNSELITNVLIKEQSETNLFKFEHIFVAPQICSKEPFVLIGDLSDPIPQTYGSRETLPSDIDLTHFRLQRQYIYAKCHGYETIKQFLESQKCQCHSVPYQESSHTTTKYDVNDIPQFTTSITYETSLESILLDDIPRLQDCPLRKCINCIEKDFFPYLPSYLEYTEENFRRVTAILGETSKAGVTAPELISAKNIAYSELPFTGTKESHHNLGTQYSSQEDLKLKEILCPCMENLPEKTIKSSKNTIIQSTSIRDFSEIESKRKKSLDRLIRERPDVLKVFTDECYDYKL